MTVPIMPIASGLRRLRVGARMVAVALLSSMSIAQAPVGGPRSDGFPGFALPLHQVTLNALRTGRVSAILVDEGRMAQANDVLLELADESMQARVLRARIRAETTVPIELAQTQYQAAQRELERLTDLQQTNSAARKEYDDARNACEIARIELEGAKYDHELARADFEVEQKSLEQLTLRAPMKAYVVRRLAEVGRVVELGDELLEIARLDVLKVEVDCPLSVLAAVRVGAMVSVFPAERDWQPRTGQIEMISRAADRASQTSRVVVRVDNSDGGWLAGMRVSVHLESPLEEAPRNASAALKKNSSPAQAAASPRPVPAPSRGN